MSQYSATLLHEAHSPDTAYCSSVSLCSSPRATGIFTPTDTRVNFSIFDNDVACRRTCLAGTFAVYNASVGDLCVPCTPGCESLGPHSSGCFFLSFESEFLSIDRSICSPLSLPMTHSPPPIDYCTGGCDPPTACSPGTATNLTAKTSASDCVACDNGKFAVAAASTQCSSVPAGYRAIAGKTNIEQCAAGTISAFGVGTCSSCATGRYADTAGLAVCLECPKGWSFLVLSSLVSSRPVSPCLAPSHPVSSPHPAITSTT